MTPQNILEVFQALAPAIAVYAAIRADIATLQERTKNHTAQIAELFNRTNRRGGERE